MNRLTLGALTALAATQIAGCIITSDNDVQEEGYITVDWKLKFVGSNVLEPCPAGYDTVALYTQEVDSNGDPVEPPFMEIFPCSAGTAVSAPLPPATYLTWIEIINSNNTATYAQSLSAYVDVRFENKLFEADIFYDGGYFRFDWELEGEFSRRPFQCSTVPDVNVSGVEIEATLIGSTAGYVDIFRCDNYSAITPELLAGTYQVSLAALRDPDDASIGSKSIGDQQIKGPNVVTLVKEPGQVGPVTIPLDDL